MFLCMPLDSESYFCIACIDKNCKTQKKKMFCSFIDFSKDFDSVWQVGLWKKQVASNINRNYFRIIFDMCK